MKPVNPARRRLLKAALLGTAGLALPLPAVAGRARPAATPAAARSTRKTTAPKKPAARPTTRSRKNVRSDSGGKNES